LAAAIFAQQTDDRDAIHELAQVARDVGSASRVK
jgi:hypothetical protein